MYFQYKVSDKAQIEELHVSRDFLLVKKFDEQWHQNECAHGADEHREDEHPSTVNDRLQWRKYEDGKSKRVDGGVVDDGL